MTDTKHTALADDPATAISAARKLIERPENWTRGDYEDTANGHRRFCAVGAFTASCSSPESCDIAQHAIEQIEKIVGCSLEDFNDFHTHAEVLAAFDAALAALAKSGAAS